MTINEGNLLINKGYLLKINNVIKINYNSSFTDVGYEKQSIITSKFIFPQSNYEKEHLKLATP